MEGNSPEIQLPPERLTFKISAKTEASARHLGLNEDSIAFSERAGYAMVLDGVGSSYGLLGSSEAKKRISRNVTKKETHLAMAQMRIRKLIQDTSEIINFKHDGTASTTLVLAKLIDSPEGQKVLVASVGDSRAYLLRGKDLRQITEDDSVAPSDISAKLSNASNKEDLSAEELTTFYKRNVITQSIGTQATPQVHSYYEDIKAGDNLILTSDGIHDNLTDIEIGNIVQGGGGAKELVESAKIRSMERSFRSKIDDMSAIVVRVEG